MKKAFAFIGSSMGKNSCTAQFAEMIFSQAQQQYGDDFEYEVITSDQVTLNPCRGCCNCFRDCLCPQDEQDDMAMIKKKLLEADFIIWGSPVYAHQVSGQMKIFIDRISYWLHLLRLAGKPGIVLTTTASSGQMEVISYLSKIMRHTGCKPVAAYWAFAHFQGRFKNPDNVKKKAAKAAIIVCDYLNGEKILSAGEAQEQLFSVLKNGIISDREYKPGEYSFWEQQGYLECNSFAELLQKKVAHISGLAEK